MPLIHSKSKKAFKKNIETEMEANPSPDKRKQNIAIAYSIQRRSPKKMASGGMVPMQEEDDSPVSVADAIMRRKKQANSEDGTVDIQKNGEEDDFYASFDEANSPKDIYDDEQLSPQPEDSNEHGDEGMEDGTMVDRIRRRMKRGA